MLNSTCWNGMTHPDRVKRKEGLAIIHHYMFEEEIEGKAPFGFFCGGIWRNFLVKPYHNQALARKTLHISIQKWLCSRLLSFTLTFKKCFNIPTLTFTIRAAARFSNGVRCWCSWGDLFSEFYCCCCEDVLFNFYHWSLLFSRFSMLTSSKKYIKNKKN